MHQSKLSSLDNQTTFVAFGILVVACALASIFLYTPIPLLLPPAIIFVLFSIARPQYLFVFFFAILPFSTEIQLGSLGTDLPSEPLMVSLMGIAFLYIIRNAQKISAKVISHPISLLLILHLSWIAACCFFSTEVVVSVKYFLAKLWYVVPFYFFVLMLFREEKGYRLILRILSFTLALSVVYVLVNHASYGFSFESANKVVRPIFRNHVNYAIMLVAFLPYHWYLMQARDSGKSVIDVIILIIFILGIYFSFTRAAQASIFLAIMFYWIVRLNLIKLSMGMALVLLMSLVIYLSVDNKYLQYAPEYEKTITHKKFDNLLEATTKMQDISTVERFYRWVAGAYMIKERPLTGFGPGTFYFQYRPYTVTSYKTYVSDNPEKSGIHNNYLMVAVEQGILGFIIFFALILLPLLYLEKNYHNLKSKKDQALLMAAGISFFLIAVVILINDLIEADKVGPFFFLSIAIIVLYDIKSPKKQNKPIEHH